MKFLLVLNVILFLANLWFLLAQGYNDINFAGLCFTFVALLDAMYMIIEDKINESYN